MFQINYIWRDKVPQMKILTKEDAQNHYEQFTGGKLKNIEEFGVEQSEGNRELQVRRK